MIEIHALGRAFLGCVAVGLLGAGVAQAQPRHQPAFKLTPPEIRLPLMKQPPKIDGTLHEAEWAGADQMRGFAAFGGSGGTLTDQKGSFWVGSDAKNLYIALRTETPPGGKILSRANPVTGGGNAKAIFADDSIELWVCPNPDAPPAERRVYQGLLNARGATYDSVQTLRGGTKWHGHWTVKSSVQDDHWDCEITIPWSDFGLDSPAGKTTAVRVVRNWMQTAGGGQHGRIQSEWGLANEAFASLSSMPRVTWDEKAPVVQVRQLQDKPDQPVDIRLGLANPGPSAQNLAVTVHVVPEGNAETNYKKDLTLTPGQDQPLEVKAAGSRGEALDTRIQVASADGKTIYYRRDFTWSVDRPAEVWNLNSESNRRIGVDFAYFPSYNAMHVKVDLSNLKNRDQVKAIQLAIRKKGSSDALAQTTMPPLKQSVSELRDWKIPALAEGDYELVTIAQGAGGEPVVEPFVRQKFEWEGNQLGRSDIVVPPFTPIAVKGNEVDVILRQHQVNGAGLWDQVRADGKPLLKGPMRLEAVIDGQTVLAQGTVKAGEHRDTRAVLQAQWQAGALKGSTQDTWDYDGLMKSVITLEPTSRQVQSLTLVIPVDAAMAPLMHATTFGNKFNYAGEIPRGNGVVWKSSQAPANAFIGTYVPYIWVGAQERGLSVFGDNDAGWITDDKSDCQQIVRRDDGTLELRLHLIQKPATWDKPRRITLGFMATPAKPMPSDWRLWTVAAARTSNATSQANVPGMLKQAFFGSYIYWGGISNSGDIYPDDGNVSIWEEFARLRKTGKYDPAFLQKWSDLAYAKVGKTRPARLKGLEAGARAGLLSMATQPQNVLIYTNAMGMRCDTPAARTFINEWSREPFPQRQWGYATGSDYGVNPVLSYRDMRAWWYKKSLELFNDAIYWDCVMLSPAYNPIASDAYERPDGQVQPSAGIWEKRALVKRGAVLAQEMGKRNTNMVHMSGTEIVPINDFSATQADWELKYGAGDFQDKFPRDYIQAQTIGRQAGLVPIVLLNQKFIVGTKQEAAQQYRTAAGVMLSHELKPWSSRGQWVKPDCFWENYDRLVNFGYGQEGTKVYNYWQSDYPARISGQSASLLVSKPGAAMLVLCDYGDGGAFTVQLDAKALALGSSLKAVNVENDQAVEINGDTLTVPLKKHDFMVIRIEGGK